MFCESCQCEHPGMSFTPEVRAKVEAEFMEFLRRSKEVVGVPVYVTLIACTQPPDGHTKVDSALYSNMPPQLALSCMAEARDALLVYAASGGGEAPDEGEFKRGEEIASIKH